MNEHKPNDKHKAFYDEFVALLKKHSDGISAVDMLAVVANIAGKLVALQDGSKVSPERAIAIVAKNMEHGNREQLLALDRTVGSA